nr:Magnetosome protein MamP [uncultured bacterium]
MAMIPPKLLLPLVIGLTAATVVFLTRKGAEPTPAATMAPSAQAVQMAQPFVPPPSAAAPGELAQMGAPSVEPMPLEPTVPNYIPRNLRLFEGHWQGMDGRLLTDELSQKLRFPKGLQGILLGEVTLNAARSGLLGGDVIIKVEGIPVPTIEEWQRVSRDLANRSEVLLTVLRKEGGVSLDITRAKRSTQRMGLPYDGAGAGGNGVVMRTLNLVLRADNTVGFVQVEAAPMILAGDPRPHPDRGPCTSCHPIGKGLELTPDPDLISLPPPVISQRQVARTGAPHENRGPCEACHVIQ